METCTDEIKSKKTKAESQKEYREQNKEKFKQYAKKYYYNNKEKCIENNKKYRTNLRQKLAEKELLIQELLTKNSTNLS